MSGIARKLMGVTKGVAGVQFIASSAAHSVSHGPTTIAIGVPESVQEGDYVLFCGRSGNASLFTPSEAFTHLAGASSSGGTDHISVWGKIRESGDPQQYTFNRSVTGGTFSGVLVFLRNAQVDVVGDVSNLNFTAPSITASESGYLIALYTWNQVISSIDTTPEGMGEIVRTDLTLAGGNLAYGQAIEAGNTGDKVLGVVVSTRHSLQISFKEV